MGNGLQTDLAVMGVGGGLVGVLILGALAIDMGLGPGLVVKAVLVAKPF